MLKLNDVPSEQAMPESQRFHAPLSVMVYDFNSGSSYSSELILSNSEQRSSVSAYHTWTSGPHFAL